MERQKHDFKTNLARIQIETENHQANALLGKKITFKSMEHVNTQLPKIKQQSVQKQRIVQKNQIMRIANALDFQLHNNCKPLPSFVNDLHQTNLCESKTQMNNRFERSFLNEAFEVPKIRQTNSIMQKSHAKPSLTANPSFSIKREDQQNLTSNRKVKIEPLQISIQFQRKERALLANENFS